MYILLTNKDTKTEQTLCVVFWILQKRSFRISAYFTNFKHIHRPMKMYLMPFID